MKPCYRVSALLALLCLAATPAAYPQSRPGGAAARPPNVVIIFADDLGYGDLSSYGQTEWRTPRIDQMAEEGVRLTSFYVPTPYCAPSRATLLTGRYPFRTGMTRNPTPDAGPVVVGARPDPDEIGLDPAEVTLAEALRDAGYATGMVGKWHLGHQPRFFPRRQGFDEFLGILYSNDMRPVRLIENERVVEDPVEQATLTQRYTRRAIDFIERNRDRPFFLYLAHAMPHKPLAASEDFYTPETPADLYADVMRELDWSVGEVLDRIHSLGLDEETLVIFLSDNGPWFGGSTGGLRGMKADSWDGGTHVPFIARWPGKIAAGRVSDELAASVDVFPTVLGAAGVEPPRDRVLDGFDLMPVLNGALTPHDAVFTMEGEDLYTIRSGRWKLHVRATPDRFAARFPGGDDWVDPRAPDGVTILAPREQYRPSAFPGVRGGVEPQPMMLFDLAADPAEQRNVAAQHPDVVRQLKARFDAIDPARVRETR